MNEYPLLRRIDRSLLDKLTKRTRNVERKSGNSFIHSFIYFRQLRSIDIHIKHTTYTEKKNTQTETDRKKTRFEKKYSLHL